MFNIHITFIKRLKLAKLLLKIQLNFIVILNKDEWQVYMTLGKYSKIWDRVHIRFL